MKCWELKYASHFAFLYYENEFGCCVENIHKIWVESNEYHTNTGIQIEEVADCTNCLKATDCNLAEHQLPENVKYCISCRVTDAFVSSPKPLNVHFPQRISLFGARRWSTREA